MRSRVVSPSDQPALLHGRLDEAREQGMRVERLRLQLRAETPTNQGWSVDRQLRLIGAQPHRFAHVAIGRAALLEAFRGHPFGDEADNGLLVLSKMIFSTAPAF